MTPGREPEKPAPGVNSRMEDKRDASKGINIFLVNFA